MQNSCCWGEKWVIRKGNRVKLMCASIKMSVAHNPAAGMTSFPTFNSRVQQTSSTVMTKPRNKGSSPEPESK